MSNVSVSLNSKVKSQAVDSYFLLLGSHSSVLNRGGGWRSLRKANRGAASSPINPGLFPNISSYPSQFSPLIQELGSQQCLQR